MLPRLNLGANRLCQEHKSTTVTAWSPDFHAYKGYVVCNEITFFFHFLLKIQNYDQATNKNLASWALTVLKEAITEPRSSTQELKMHASFWETVTQTILEKVIARQITASAKALPLYRLCWSLQLLFLVFFAIRRKTIQYFQIAALTESCYSHC